MHSIVSALGLASPNASILWFCEMESLICNFCLIVVAHTVQGCQSSALWQKSFLFSFFLGPSAFLKNRQKKNTGLQHCHYQKSLKSLGKQSLTSWFAGVCTSSVSGQSESIVSWATRHSTSDALNHARLPMTKRRCRDVNLPFLSKIVLLCCRFHIFQKIITLSFPSHQWCSWPLISWWLIWLHKGNSGLVLD